MNYQQTIDYLFTRLPMFSRIGANAIKKDITNTVQLCASLHNPHTKFKSVHIAGTNGKGSVSHMLAAIFQTAGYKTGLYTSPHLKDFRERIRINGEMIAKEFVVDFVQRMQAEVEEMNPSFFEITVAMAFDYFAKEKVDIAIVEVGLGGRLDSTNIITPELSVITNISWDHMNVLGDTLQKIAFEKAGIIKSNIPVIIGETSADTKPIFEAVAGSKQARISFADQVRYVSGWNYDKTHLAVEIANLVRDEHHTYHLDLTGYYQTKNLVTVLEAVAQLQLKDWKISQTQLEKALQHVKKYTGLHGRWEIIQQHPMVALDVGHNVAGIKQIVAQVEMTDYNDLHVIIGMVKDKDIDNVLAILPKEATYYFTRADIPRAIPEPELAEKGKNIGLKGNDYSNVNKALEAARRQAGKEDLILVCGSVFVVGEVELIS
ncbi:MAG: bifunctional folylpolyglutamate synthase/dihydrofolate synthase [Chitinophagaceae bacterium]|nr:bifunctional folylpolyglutamate synthase/dihydrofolate synthase [Chitinophagaceae bacterium]